MLGPTRFHLPAVDTTDVETVYLLQYSTWGHHSLAFYDAPYLVEFTYGDWALFALDQRDMWTAVSHMLWPTQGALGRKQIPWKPGEDIHPHFTNCQAVAPLTVARSLALSLYHKLSHNFEKQQSRAVFHEKDQVYFVPYSAPYGLWHNCNHELADWLEALGGRISGRVFWNPDFINGMRPPTTP